MSEDNIDLAQSSEPTAHFSVFVYGTLKPGGLYYRELCERYAPEAIRAWMPGRLYHLPDFGYPAVSAGTDLIQGYVLRFADAEVLPALDALEVYDAAADPAQNMYQRLRARVESEQGPLEVWVYLMSAAKVAEYRGEYLPSGDWDHLSPRA